MSRTLKRRKKIRIGGVGIGRGGSLYGLATGDHRVQLVAVCDIDIEAHKRRNMFRDFEARGV